jgi:penicillin-binding protein 2
MGIYALATIYYKVALMHLDSERHKLFTRRALFLAGGKASLMAALIARMYYLQVVEADRYRTLADENRINLRLLAPRRGQIVDRFGIPIADNQQNYRVLLISENTRDIEYTLDALSQIISINPAERRRTIREIKRNRSFVPVSIRSNLDWQEVSRIEVNAPNLPGIFIDVGQSRNYSYGADTAHVLGYVAAVSAKELNGDPLLELPGFRIGKAGIEKIHDKVLRGSGGSSQVEVNAFGRVIRELSRSEGQAGSEVAVTLDLGLQRMISKRLKEESASVVVIDVRTGDVLSMVSTPGYDPNAFNRGLKREEWKSLVSNPRSPLINKSIAGHYSPGSTFKMVVLLAALEKGTITPNTKVFCRGYIELGDSKFHCWKKHGHGVVDAKMAITQSCDVYFYEIAKRTGIDRISVMANRFGLGVKTGVDLPGEKAGLVPNKKWKRRALDAPWHQGETLHAGIGQGYILTTPLQLAVMTAHLSNGGLAITPRLTKRVNSQADGTKVKQALKPKSLGIYSAHLKLIQESMSEVVNNPVFGTAKMSRINEPGMEMAGKTGTVQVRRISKSERESGVIKNKNLPWKERDHALFVGFAPIHEPRYAIAVVVEHGGGGSSVAAPIARDILLEAQRRDSIGTGLSGSKKSDLDSNIEKLD